MMDLSIIIPVYNAKLIDIENCVNSISFSCKYNIECIIIDDSDNDVAYNFFKKNFISDKLIYVKNDIKLGLGRSLNLGVNISRSKYIMRLDIDDMNLPGRIESQIECIRNNNFDVVGSVCRDTFYKKLKYPKYDFLIKLSLSFINPIIHPSVVIKRDILVNFLYGNLKYCEDLDLWLRLRNKGYNFFNIDDNLLFYSKPFFIRGHGNWLTNFYVRLKNLKFNFYFFFDILGIFFIFLIYLYSVIIFYKKYYLRKMHY